MGLPDSFIRRLRALCPQHRFNEVLDSFGIDKQTGFRINSLREDESTLRALRAGGVDCEPVLWAHERGVLAYQCSPAQREKLTHSPAAAQGEVYVQGLSSMLAPVVLAPEDEHWVLDLAAAPGGKTILMAEMMNNRGRISAVEPVKARFFRLRANLERMGIRNTRLYMKDGRAVGRLKPDSFDRIMLDAPCSSESRFSAVDERSWSHWSPRKVAECARKQRRLILSGFDALKPGGVMLYCTCAFSPEENEAVVSHLLRRRPSASLAPCKLPIAHASAGVTHWQGKSFHPDVVNTRRVWPNAQMDGFYLALITKPQAQRNTPLAGV